MSESIKLSPSLDYSNKRWCEMTASGGAGGCLTWCPQILWEGSDAGARSEGNGMSRGICTALRGLQCSLSCWWKPDWSQSGGARATGEERWELSWLCWPAWVPTVSLASPPGHPEPIALPRTRSRSESVQGGAVLQGTAEPGQLYLKSCCKPSVDSHKTN